MAYSESAQQREFQKYYQPWLLSLTPSATKSTSLPRDTTLIALAQLAALRLKVESSTISLFDNETRILLATAGQSSSLGRSIDRPEEPQDHPESSTHHWAQFVDKYVIGSTWKPPTSTGQDVFYAAFVATDVAKDSRLVRDASLIAGEPTGFFAGVPIIAHQGHTIGVFAVSDPSPRPGGLTSNDVKFLQDTSCIAFDHLERTRSIADRAQSEGFVRGLAFFVEGLSNFKRRLNQQGEELVVDSKETSASDADFPHATDPQEDVEKGEILGHLSSKPSATVHSPSRSRSGKSATTDAVEPKHATDTHSSTNRDTERAAGNIKQIFERAARAIREGTGAQGCIFFDASPSLLAGPGTSSSDKPSRFVLDAESSADELTDQSRDESVIAAQDPTHQGHGSYDTTPRRPGEPATILGTSLAPGETTSIQEALSQNELRRFLQRYPYGKSFWAGEGEVAMNEQSLVDNTVTGAGAEENDSELHIPLNKSTRPRKGISDGLLKYLPHAKEVVFLPLFSFAQQQWYAGGLVWTNEPGFRGLGAQMPYLKAFGSCIMSEVTGMEALNISIARTTFIASISHDLRSPLHGILGNLEFLEDTLTSAYQVSLVGSIETCGKTLLDTIDHLLDHAKINNLNRAAGRNDSRRNGIPRLSGSNSSPMTTFDLALLVEEVAEAAFAGQTFRKKNLRGRDVIDEAADEIHSLSIDDSKSTEQSVHQGSAKFSGRVFFVLEIQHADSWLVASHSSGSIRRIILNVIGNAIKYCNSGLIETKLWQPRVRDGNTEVTISVRDTGIGMSQNFLANHLFKAFSQEDSFAPGAGLGLSIARQLVDKLHGRISVKSEKGMGTHVDITLPVLLEAPKHCDRQDILYTASRVTTGKKICLLNPETDGSIVSDGQISRLAASIADMCQKWFNLEFTESSKIDAQPDADIFIYAEPPPIEYLIRHHSERKAAGKDGKETALLIVCTNAFEAAALRTAGVSHLTALGRVIEVISQPVGVRKLAKVLLSSLQRVEATRGAVTSEISPQVATAAEASLSSSDTKWSSNPVVYDPIVKQYRPSIEALKWKSEQPQVQAPLEAADLDNGDLEFGRIKAGALPEATPMLPKPTENGRDETRMPSVLLVDDNPINLRLLVTFMKKIKLPYAEAVNGLEAYNKFKDADTPFDFVLMDLQMPVMDGLESTRKIREYEQEVESARPATIIAITGVGSESVKSECMESGMTQFLTKPVKFKTLQQLLERHNRA